MQKSAPVKHEDNPRSIKYYIKNFIYENKSWYTHKLIIDFPAGNGITSRLLKEIGAEVIPMDLFPEYFKEKDLTCLRANITEGIPFGEGKADGIICQEGIEHFPNQVGALREFNRVLMDKGRLVITTPNYSNLISRLSYLFMESEKCNSTMPPNEIDSIWMADPKISSEVYFGHIFLLGIQKLRVQAILAGFKIRKIYPTRKKSGAMFAFPFLYPILYLSARITYLKNRRKVRNNPASIKVYREIFRLAINPRILVDSHLMVEFEKVTDFSKVGENLQSQHQYFGDT